MTSFKLFLENSNFLSKNKLVGLPDIEANNVEDVFKVGKVTFDQHKGLGATPNNRNVVYRGFVAELKPSTFLKLVTPADRGEDSKKFVGLIEKGTSLASPTLYISINEEEFENGEPLKVKITGHEGRARTWAFDTINGNVPMPVHFILEGGMRARDLSKKFFDALAETGFIPQDVSKDATPTKVNIGRIFWMGKIL